jgi:hypothetical protein
MEQSALQDVPGLLKDMHHPSCALWGELHRSRMVASCVKGILIRENIASSVLTQPGWNRLIHAAGFDPQSDWAALGPVQFGQDFM